ncbi:citrate synthase [Nocardia sp. 348MFTsu5.1]|uniref:citrate synthase n=1 Tax=Nocardia sp. 348MFTsu5.1 TaxID=1172185 RepID=UPI0005682CCB|nr:citrate synthase [Nocardia sp. 348MFTsu5.1]
MTTEIRRGGHRRRWPTPLRHDGRDYLTTAQVARVLGVKTQTVYAYASRGTLTSARIDGVSGSLFAVDEVDAVARRSSSRPPAGVVERIRTQITLLENDHLYYRGHDATVLAGDTRFETVAELLWDHSTTWDVKLLPAKVFRQISALQPPTGRGVDTIKMVVDVLGSRDASRHQRSPDAICARAAGILANSVEALPLLSDKPALDTSLAARLWPRLSTITPTRQRIRLLNMALVLLADHDLTSGTVAARVAASSRGSIYSVVTSGLGALDGSLHGGASTLAYRFLREATTNPTAAISMELEASGSIPGCGHVVYTDHDPRSDTLLTALDDASGGNRKVMPTVAGLRPLLDRAGAGFMNSDMALAALALRYDMAPDAAETIFALSRIAGWVAHAIEEYNEPQLRFRPEGVYVGIRP